MSLKGALNQNGLVFFKPIWIASKIWLGRICCSICYIIHFGFNRCLLGIPWPKYDLWISHGFKTDDTVSNYNVISLQVWKICNFFYYALASKNILKFHIGYHNFGHTSGNLRFWYAVLDDWVVLPICVGCYSSYLSACLLQVIIVLISTH